MDLPQSRDKGFTIDLIRCLSLALAVFLSYLLFNKTHFCLEKLVDECSPVLWTEWHTVGMSPNPIYHMAIHFHPDIPRFRVCQLLGRDLGVNSQDTIQRRKRCRLCKNPCSISCFLSHQVPYFNWDLNTKLWKFSSGSWRSRCSSEFGSCLVPGCKSSWERPWN